MGVSGGSKSSGEGLVFYIDPANSRSYSGIGNTIYDLINTSIGGTFINGALIDPTNNRSIYIDGVNDYVAFPVNTSLNFGSGDFTVNIWLKASSVSLYGTIFALDNTSQGNGILMYTEQTTGTLRTWCRGVTKVGTIRICTNAWTQVTLTRTSGTCRQYVNGVLDETYSSALAITSDHNLRIGYPYIDNYPFFGYFGQVQAYNRALPASEILNQYNRNIKKYVATENSVNDGLVLNYDASNSRSYVGTGVTINNLSGIGNTGILVNGPTFSQLNGGSIVFDGTNDYINVADSPSLGMSSVNTVTVYAWFYATADGINSTREIIHKRNNDPTYVSYGISWGSSSNKNILFSRFGFDDGTVSDLNSDALPKLKWINACTTFDGSNHNMYIDGYLVKNATVSNKRIKDDNLPVTLGSFNGSQEYFQGYISDAKIYNRALSSTEVLQNYNATKNRYIRALPAITSGLVLNLDAGSRASYLGVGNSWNDISGSGFALTLRNSPTFVASGESSYFTLNGSNQDFYLASYGPTFTEITFNLWVWRNGTQSGFAGLVISRGNASGFFYTNQAGNPLTYMWLGDGNTYNYSSGLDTANQTWSMATLTLTSTNVKWYINGILQHTRVNAHTSSTFSNLYIGSDGGLGGRYYNGRIAMVQLYNRALTDAEILQNFNAYRTRYGV